jgi:hypothetical protein
MNTIHLCRQCQTQGYPETWIAVLTSSTDDSFYKVDWDIAFLGNFYDGAYLSTNGFITFGSGSNIYTGFSPTVPPLPTVFVWAEDLIALKIYKKQVGDIMLVRYEGIEYSRTPGGSPIPTFIYEVAFGQTGYIEVTICTKQFFGQGYTGVSDGSSGTLKLGSLPVQANVQNSFVISCASTLCGLKSPAFFTALDPNAAQPTFSPTSAPTYGPVPAQPTPDFVDWAVGCRGYTASSTMVYDTAAGYGSDDSNFYMANSQVDIDFQGASKRGLFMGSNGYITFENGWNIYEGFSGNVPDEPTLFVVAADLRMMRGGYENIQVNGAPAFWIRYEGKPYYFY